MNNPDNITDSYWERVIEPKIDDVLIKNRIHFISDYLIRLFIQFMHHKCQLFHNENKTYLYFCIDKID